MGRQVRHCGRVCAAALTVLVSAELRADVPPLTLDFAGKNASGVYVVSPGGMSFVGSLSATELNIGGLVPSDNGTAVGVLSPANTSLANRAYLGSNDVGVSNFRFHSSDFADRDNWDNPRDIYQGADDPLPIAIPGVPTFNDDLVFTPPGTPPLASTVTFANGSLNLGQLRMLAGSRDGAPAYDNTLSLAGIWTTAQSCTLNDDADPGQMLNRVGGTSRMTLDAQSGLILSGDLVMGNTGTAVLTAAGGQVRAANVNVGNQTGAQGVLSVGSAASLQVTGATRVGVAAYQ